LCHQQYYVSISHRFDFVVYVQNIGVLIYTGSAFKFHKIYQDLIIKLPPSKALTHESSKFLLSGNRCRESDLKHLLVLTHFVAKQRWRLVTTKNPLSRRKIMSSKANGPVSMLDDWFERAVAVSTEDPSSLGRVSHKWHMQQCSVLLTTSAS
jgi:hypothetical protein